MCICVCVPVSHLCVLRCLAFAEEAASRLIQREGRVRAALDRACEALRKEREERVNEVAAIKVHCAYASIDFSVILVVLHIYVFDLIDELIVDICLDIYLI